MDRRRVNFPTASSGSLPIGRKFSMRSADSAKDSSTWSLRTSKLHCGVSSWEPCMDRSGVMAPVRIFPIRLLAPTHRNLDTRFDSGVPHQFEPPRVDVVDIIAERARRYFSHAPSGTRSITRKGDSRKPEIVRDACEGHRPKWIITSPPYYGLRTYQPDQWLRQWFLGGPAQTSYDVGPQLSHRSQDTFVTDLRSVWENIAAVTTDDARLVVRFGAINNRPLDPIAVLEASLERTSWRLHRTVSAGTAAKGRRQAVAFSSTPNAAALPEYDFWATKIAA